MLILLWLLKISPSWESLLWGTCENILLKILSTILSWCCEWVSDTTTDTDQTNRWVNHSKLVTIYGSRPAVRNPLTPFAKPTHIPKTGFTGFGLILRSVWVVCASGSHRWSAATANTTGRNTWSTWSHDKSTGQPHDYTWCTGSPPGTDQSGPGMA